MEEVQNAQKVMNSEAIAIKKCSEKLDENFVKALNILYSDEGKVIVTGIGKSGHLAKKVAATLCSTGTPALLSCILPKQYTEILEFIKQMIQ